jgi:hypothetical protein
LADRLPNPPVLIISDVERNFSLSSLYKLVGMFAFNSEEDSLEAIAALGAFSHITSMTTQFSSSSSSCSNDDSFFLFLLGEEDDDDDDDEYFGVLLTMRMQGDALSSAGSAAAAT